MAYDSAAPYKPENPIRVVTAASLFDGHDAAINLIRRLLQSSGAEVVHLGHNRSAREIVDCAIQEDAQAIAITSYQGGHLEYFKYVHDLLKERGADIKVFGGGGGTILPDEIAELHAYGISRIYSPDDGRALGLQGMIDDLLKTSDFATGRIALDETAREGLTARDPKTLGRLISLAENQIERQDELHAFLKKLRKGGHTPVLGITGTGGAGKSSLIDELVQRFLRSFPDKRLGILSVDPSKRKSGGALLGDRIRMNAIGSERVYMRSLATRQANLALSRHVRSALQVLDAAAFDLVILETSGIGQSDTEITEHSDVSLYVMTSEYGAATQLEKIDMLDFADLIAINKFDKPGSLDALRDVRKQYRRNHNRFEGADEDLPIHGTIASQFNDAGMNRLFADLMQTLSERTKSPLALDAPPAEGLEGKAGILPAKRARYLAEIAEGNRRQAAFIESQAQIASRLFRIHGAIRALREELPSGGGGPVGGEGPTREGLLPFTAPEAREGDGPEIEALRTRYDEIARHLDPDTARLLEGWPELVASYAGDKYRFQVREKTIELDLVTTSLSGLRIPKVCLPRFADWGEIVRFAFRENVPGAFPYTAGVFPLKREGEDPARMFAGEGGPERTNKRFHYVSTGLPAKRLSTAFDSVTLYGEDPDHRPDIYGKIGNSGVSIATLDDAKKLYSGFDLADPRTSVSMTINGPAPMLLAFFMNTAVDQQCERWLAENGKLEEASKKIDALYEEKGMERPRYQGDLPEGNDGLGLALLGVTGDEILPKEVYERIAADTVTKVRGTVQADILKEDQAQNTCIFSTEFALRMMGDIQQWFVENGVRNFYSVSISGYHIAEAGANPITQLALTLANGFTYVESYLARGMKIDDFAPNLSFFFSNGVDPEYAVIGRVARRIWARAIKHLYGGNERSQKLKYHIQTSGRSLHAQEIAFNDIRTTLQALYAIYDNCNSLHTNAYDEAITTPTEESVRRALAIQLIINKELGLAKNENPLQGAFIIEELTDLVEEAVLMEFERLNDRGGVLGAMERMYQRGKIQDESLHYEAKKHSGELPLIGVNTFLDSKGSPTIVPPEVIRSTEEEREYAIRSCHAFQERGAARAEGSLADLQRAATSGGNVFASLLEVTKCASLGQISHALYEVGGQYRRNM